MSYPLSNVTTRTGDDGMTSLSNGTRLEKDSPRVVAMGAIDELRSHIAVVLAYGPTANVRTCLVQVQRRLLEACAQLSSPGERHITDEDVVAIEHAAERFGAQVESFKEFEMPNGPLAAATCHVARSVCRRAEAHIVSLNTMDPVKDDSLIPFLDRLSHLLNLVASVLNKGRQEPGGDIVPP